MDHDPNIFRDSSQVIQEIEDQLERILQKKFRDVDSELVERINREKEAARGRKEEIEREFDKEKTALTDYRVMVRDFEEQRAGLLNEARDRFQKVLKFQAEIENLAKSTVDEIKKVNEIQERLVGLRAKTSERAAFLKNDLKERFGIVAEVMEEEPKPLGLDLDEELEKLRKIKDLLAIESAAASLGRMGGEPARREDLAVMDAAADSPGVEIPELQDLIAGPAAPDNPKTPAEEAPPVETALEPAPEPVPDASEMKTSRVFWAVGAAAGFVFNVTRYDGERVAPKSMKLPSRALPVVAVASDVSVIVAVVAVPFSNLAVAFIAMLHTPCRCNVSGFDRAEPQLFDSIDRPFLQDGQVGSRNSSWPEHCQ